MDHREILALPKQTRLELWHDLIETIENYIANVHAVQVSPDAAVAEIRTLLELFQFDQPLAAHEALQFAAKSLWNCQVHTPHPRYFGLFNPAPTTMGIVADALVAAFNPQLATGNHSPFAVAAEQHLVRTFGSRFGYEPDETDGTFASGGAEANHTAILTALEYLFPAFAQRGIRGLEKQPLMYISAESHHSFVKAARACGLGTDAVRSIAVDDTLRISTGALTERIKRDRAAGESPFLIVANAGTTNAGVVDPIVSLADIAQREKIWLHVDAAWGGAAIFIPELRSLLEGIERSDSITFDAHKWLSVPMAAGLYLTRHKNILSRAFRITTEYMPAAEADLPDPYTHSLQWSRRFIGLKVFLSLAVAGWDGYRVSIGHQAAMGDLLRRELEKAEWEIVNRTKLPLVCFVDRQRPEGKTETFIDAIAKEIVSSGAAWISTTRLDKNMPVLRACITNFRTAEEDIYALVEAVNTARRKYYKRN